MTAVLVIAGTDSSGGAGLVRDVRTLQHFGTEALCTVTAVTAQSQGRVSAVHHVPPQVVREQIAAALATGRVSAIKIGMLGRRDTVLAVAEAVPSRAAVPIVLDPVLASSSGTALLDEDGRQALVASLLPRVTVLTPNIPEAAALLAAPAAEQEEQLLEQALALRMLGPEAVLLKGGHGAGVDAVDYLVTRTDSAQRLAAPRLAATRRGTGCALASGIAAGLAAGLALPEACARAKRHVTELLQQRY